MKCWAECSRGLPISNKPEHMREIFKHDEKICAMPNVSWRAEEVVTDRIKEAHIFKFLRDDLLPMNHLETNVMESINECSAQIIKPLKYDIDVEMHTFRFSEEMVRKLKEEAQASSSFVAVIAHFWKCLTQAREVPDTEPVDISVVADLRGRVKPPLPPTYFGNCLCLGLVRTSAQRLLGQHVSFAASLIQLLIDSCTMEMQLNNMVDWVSSNQSRVISNLIETLRVCPHDATVAGSPKFPVYEIDHGWGKPLNVQPPHLNIGVISLISGSADVASLEKKTLQNLYISKHSNSKSRQDQLLQGSSLPETKPKELHIVDVDTDHMDPRMCTVYARDIDQHIRDAEVKRRATANYMEEVQEDINANMRGILIDWLVEVAEEYKLVPDTLYLTVSYIDRYLSNNVVNRQRLQLLGVTCMLIAAKYEEICAPQVEEFCYITDNTYFRDEVLQMESQVLQHLHFELSSPTIKSFLRRFIRAAQVCHQVQYLQLEFLANYLAELTLPEYSFIGYLPSLVAASAVFLAKFTLDPTKKPWTPTLKHYTRYQPSELQLCVKELHHLQCNIQGCGLPAIREKYGQHKFKCVSIMVPPATIPLEFFSDF